MLSIGAVRPLNWAVRERSGLRERYDGSMKCNIFRFEYPLFLVENMFPASSGLCAKGILSLQNPSLRHPHNVGILVLRTEASCLDVPAVQSERLIEIPQVLLGLLSNSFCTTLEYPFHSAILT